MHFMQRWFSKKLDNDRKLTGACIFCDGTLENNICAITCYNYIPNCKFGCCKDENSVYYCTHKDISGCAKYNIIDLNTCSQSNFNKNPGMRAKYDCQSRK